MFFSIILTAHSEGLLAHKTLLSIFEAIKKLPKDTTVEIVVHLDKADNDTVNYFERYKKDKRFTFVSSSFGDLGLSRNAAIKVAAGKYIVTIDGDDLMSSDYLISAYNALKNDDSIIYHPKYILSFGAKNEIKICHDQNSKEEETFVLFSENDWSSNLICKKEFLEKYPYEGSANLYGHEDFQLNIKTVDANIKHSIIEDAVLFYRRDESSLSVQNWRKLCTQRRCDMFSFENFKTLSAEYEKFLPAPEQTQRKSLKKKMVASYVRARNTKIGNTIIEPFANLAKKVSGKSLVGAQKDERLPKHVVEQWKEISHIERQTYPTTEKINSMFVYDARACLNKSLRYFEICKELKNIPPKDVDYIFIAPWLTTGGAEKVLLNYCNALKTLYPKKNIAIITTLPDKNIWANRLPSNAYHIDLGNHLEALNPRQADELLSRIIVQLNSKRIHIINSWMGYDWVNNHKTQIADFDITASIFANPCILNSEDYAYTFYGDPFAVNVYPILRNIFVDNSKVIEDLVEINGFDKEKIIVHHQPTKALKSKKSTKKPGDEKFHILWASRVCKSKNPELLIEIANKLDANKFTIDVYGSIEDKYPEDLLSNIPVINYRGPYKNFESLVKNSTVDIYLYTSLFDGLPNTLLEAGAAELPIIASNVGGVGDFIKNKETGILIDDYENVEAYIDAIKFAKANPSELKTFAKKARNFIQEEFTEEKFLFLVKKDF